MQIRNLNFNVRTTGAGTGTPFVWAHGLLSSMATEDELDWYRWAGFPQSVKLKADETVVFAWIVYKSRAQRDRINDKVMKDPRLAGMDPKQMPFDGKRMIFGGFKSLVEF